MIRLFLAVLACAEPERAVPPEPTAAIRQPIDGNISPTAAGYGYCFQMGYSCGLKGIPPVWSCSNDNGYGWYGNCN